MDQTTVGLLGFAILLGLLAIGMPICAAMFLVGLLGGFFAFGLAFVT